MGGPICMYHIKYDIRNEQSDNAHIVMSTLCIMVIPDLVQGVYDG